MGHTTTVRLTKELADWLEELSSRTGLSQSQIIREQLERARANARNRSYMRLAGAVRGARDLSSRKGFSRP
jgi:predicted DNA-binding protein